jgi:SAM-dependent methyltransferase
MAEWFQDESFWIDTYPFLFPDQRFEIAEEEVEKILTLLAFQGKTVLDLCCGPGRHALPLAKRGFTVTGVDCTPFLLEKARKRAQAEHIGIEWVLEDMRNFVRPGAYDLVINMFTSFGYFEDEDENLQVLRNIYQSLKAGGMCVIDVVAKERLARVFQPTTSERGPDGTLLMQRHEIVDDWTRIRNEWILIKGDRAKTFTFQHTIYSGQELKTLLRQAGFGSVRLFGDLEGNEYGLDARRLIAVARKALVERES